MQVGPTEIEEGNIEYKRFLYNLTESRLNHLAAQMNWRINEGNGICHYYLGVCDNGMIFNDFTQERLDYTLDMIKIMVEICNAYIESIIINRYYEYIWLNVTIKRKKEYLREYRILVLSDVVKNILINSGFNYKKMNKTIFYNTYIYNNDKYLFFEVSHKKTNKLLNKLLTSVDFNLIINNNINNINNISLLLEYIENNMTGNKEYNSNEIVFNIISKNNYISTNDIIFFGFLKQGFIKKNMQIVLNNIKYNILSIHNNMIDCDEAFSPATISIRVLPYDNL